MIDATQASIIAIMLLSPETISDVSDYAGEEWFTGDYRKAYRYLVQHGSADMISLSSGAGVSLDSVTEWISLEFTSSHLKHHLANLEAEASMRKVQYLGQQILKVETLEEATKLIERFGNSLSMRDKTEPIPIKTGINRLSKELERRHRMKGELLGMSYGVADLDKVTEGLHKGDLVIIAGSPSMGKTAFAIAVGEEVAKQDKKVLVFSCEMTVEQLLMRSLSAESAVPLWRIRGARFEDADWSRMTTSFETISKWPMMIDDPAGITLAELTRKVRKYHKAGLDLVVIDYLQIMKYDKNKENQELDVITTDLKNLAKELKICIVLLSQLNRGSEKEKRKPSMSDLRGSGMIENNADVILFPYREAANCQKCRDKIKEHDHDPIIHQSKAEIIIGKQRQGERNISIPVLWLGEKTRFVNLEKSHVQRMQAS